MSGERIHLQILLEQSAQKNQQAFKKLYDETSPILYTQALRLLKQTYLAEECLQEAYLKIWEKADTFTAERSQPLTWMITITRNTALDKLRARKARPQQHTIDDYDLSHLSSTSLLPEAMLSLGQDIKHFYLLLQGMKPKQKECLLLFCCYGHTHHELSSHLGIPLGTVKAWIRRGKQRLVATN